MTPSTIFNTLKKLFSSYEAFCSPLCKDMNVNQTAFDIIMFLANNPEYNTAKDITNKRGIKPNLVSFTVEKLVKDGFITRKEVPGDRRKIGLICTDKAQDIIAQGHDIQSRFISSLLKDIDKEDLDVLEHGISKIKNNMENTQA